MSGPNLHILEYRGDYRMPRSEGDPARARHRLDRLARAALSAAWDEGAGLSFGDGDRVVFIERVEVSVSVNGLGADDQGVARRLAGGLRQRLNEALVHRGPNDVQFPNRPAFVAAFLSDLVAGSAWGQWYYGEFASLRTAPRDRAIEEVLCQDEDVGHQALIELARSDALDALLDGFSEPCLEAVVRRCLLAADVRGASGLEPWIAALSSLLRRAQTSAGESPARQTARLYGALLRERPDLGPDSRLARWLFELLESRLRLARRQDFVERIQAGDFGGLLRAAARTEFAPAARVWAGVAHASRPENAVGLFRGLAGSAEGDAGREFVTRVGGLCLLVRHLSAALVEGKLSQRGLAAGDAAVDPAWVRYLCLLQAAGRDQLTEARRDPIVARLAGFGAPPPRDGCPEALRALFATDPSSGASVDCEDWSHGPEAGASAPPAWEELPLLRPELAVDTPEAGWDSAIATVTREALRRFAISLGAFSGSSLEYLRRQFFLVRARVRVTPAEIRVNLGRSPLHLVLRMAGYGGEGVRVEWLPHHRLRIEFDAEEE